ncbi:tetratricopeptide repeat protein [Oscillatoria sp. FACHB-1407]|uniref:tetratricopeptide repeat protein n=1 Tax=Oscillatoria sp. FACHB-1407 TaxID=2692847 RepID=UPI001687EBF0|nr:tetratricopeptide repeat protein [Oscillatoria sp. FACHB-1407]MBD2464570.1 tetratricopeptide repeat protein [Oscillatoria sp. FACHB-1407]
MQQEWYEQGLTKAQAQDYQGAIADFDQALAESPDRSEVYYQRGLAHFKLGNTEQAIADYTQALDRGLQYHSMYYARGLAHLILNHLDAAVADTKQAILLKPDQAANYELLGQIRQRQGDTGKAIASYRKAAELYLDNRDVSNCRRCLDKIQQLQPSPPPPLTPPTVVIQPSLTVEDFLQEAITKAKQGNYRGAMDDLDWVMQIDPQDAQVYVCRGQVHTQMGNLEAAIADYQQAARLFLDKADKSMAQQLLTTIGQLKTQLAQRQSFVTSVDTRSRSPRQIVPTGRPSHAVQQKLLRLVGNDRRIVTGLVERLKIKNPGMPEDWYWEKAIYDLERDRR